MKFVSVAEMQAIEREANAQGLTYEIMMENAGRNLAEVVLEEYGYLEEGGALGLVGSGNNGGDTLVALAHLAEQGWKASAYIVRPRPANDPLVARLIRANGKVYWLENDPDYKDFHDLLSDHAILLDGVLGTGFRLPLKSELADILAFTNQTLNSLEDPPCVIAVDCPSGVDCDSGETVPECIPAEMTVTMAAIKQGLFKFPASDYVGWIKTVDIGLPQQGESLQSWREVQTFVPDANWVREVIPPRPNDAHKGTFGTALVVAGSVNYTGAAFLAGQAAYRVGAGLVTLAIPSPLHVALAGQFPEATWLPLPHLEGFIAETAYDILIKNLGRPTAMLIGPGFGLEETTLGFLSRLVFETSTNASIGSSNLPPLVLDADGLKLLARIQDWQRRLPSDSILTPHPGEMSILCGLSKEDIQAERLAVAKRFSHEWGHILVLKGAYTVIAAPDGRAAVLPVASPALARAGTGDVLAGLIVGLLAQGVEPFQAAVAGAWIHAFAGLKAAQNLGNTASVLAGDVLNSTIEVINELQ